MGAGFDSALEKLRKHGITEEEHGIRGKLFLYADAMGLDKDELDNHYDSLWRGHKKEDVLQDIESLASDPLAKERISHVKLAMENAKPFDFIRFHVTRLFGSADKLYEDQLRVLALYDLKKIELPDSVWSRSLHPQLNSELARKAVEDHGEFERDRFRIPPQLKAHLRALGYTDFEMDMLKETMTQNHLEESRRRKELAEAGKRKKKEERNALRRAEREEAAKHSHEAPPAAGLIEETESLPPEPQRAGIRKSVKKKPLVRNEGELHTYFKRLVGKRAPVEGIMARMAAVTGLEGGALQREVDGHACRVIRDKLHDSETLVPTILELASLKAKRACIRDHVRQNTRVEGGRIAGLSAVRAQLKKVLRLPDEEVDAHVNEHVGALLDEMRESRKPEPAEQPAASYVKLYEGYSVGVTDHALERAKKRAGAADRTEVEGMFRRPGVHIPMAIGNEAGSRRIVKYHGKCYTFPFITDHARKRFTLMTVWLSKPHEKHLYKERLRRA